MVVWSPLHFQGQLFSSGARSTAAQLLKIQHSTALSIKQKQWTRRKAEWGHLDNTKHLIFWLCNMKQLNFKHFNINSKKFTVTVNFSQKDTKTAPKRPILFCLVYQEVFSHFATIPDHFGRFPKTTEDSRRLSEDYRRCLHTTEDFRGEIRKFSTIFRRYIHM